MNNQGSSTKKKILWVDNDAFYAQPYIEVLEDEGYEVHTAITLTQAKSSLNSIEFDAVITDIMIPIISEAEEKEWIETRGGYETGIALARWIKQNYPKLTVLGLSVRMDKEISRRFLRYGNSYKTKYELSDVQTFIQYINEWLGHNSSPKHLKTFIVHGNDEVAKYELKNFIQNTLNLGEPVILHERPSMGRTIIEKFEDEVTSVDAVFVLLTPDDLVYNSSTPNLMKRRARQNVIFELGYVLAKLERRKGRVLLLYKGELELPSDISGLVYIDITNGIDAAAENIRRELSHLTLASHRDSMN